MQEATGQTGLMNIMLTIIGIIIVLLAGSIAYSKAFRVKNKVIDIIEKYETYNQNALDEIERTLTNIGYRTMSKQYYLSYCDSDKFSGFTLANLVPGHLFCVYKSNDNDEGTYYYKVVSYMYFDIPLIGSFIKIPVTGETKVFYSKKVDDWKTVK